MSRPEPSGGGAPAAGPPARSPRFTLPSGLAGALALLLACAPPADAQYFGRNKVQYDDFDFRVLHTENFDIHFYEAESDQAIRDFGRMSERWYERLARTFQHTFREKKPIIAYADQPDFQQTNAIPGAISQGTGGVTESIKDRVILPFGATYGETDHVLGHELVHAFQFDLAKARQGGGATGFMQIPGWLIEGMPEYMSLGRVNPHTAMWMRDAVVHERLPTIKELNRGREFFPYRFGHALWAYIAGRFGDPAVPALFRAAGRRGGLEGGIQQVLHISRSELSEDWIAATREHYEPLLEDRTKPGDAGERILAPDRDGGEMNVSPALSPDGDRVVFFSQKDLFTIDLFVADARTGEIEGKLASASSNPHFDALAFIASSGAWSPDGERFAFVTYARGDNEIAIADVDDRDVERTLELAEIGAVYALDWSPDGRRLVFSGSRGGVTDLYEVDVGSGRTRQLTDDRFAELQPAYSPDGETIAFATDRGGSSDLSRLAFARMGLGLLDRGSGRVEVSRPFGKAKHINPRWSPDGESLYFISDREGFSDVYRLELASDEAYQVTRVATGVTGITGHSPALSVAKETGRLFLTVFEKGNYIGYARGPDRAAGERVTERDVGIEPGGTLPPTDVEGTSLVAEYLDDAATGLPESDRFAVSDYDAGLQLDYLAQPRGGVAVDRFGTAVGGSVAAFFSDMLGNRQLVLSLQAQGSVEDIGGQALYMNRRNRFNWGGGVSRIPFRTGFATSRDTQEGRNLLFIIERTIVNRAALGAEYPFSTTSRLEANAGVTHYGFDRDVIRTVFRNGVRVKQDEPDPAEVGLTEPDGFTVASASLAHVGDRSFFGFTSPVRGGRHRLEVEGNTGDLSFASVLADYREYVFFNPLTLAFRGMHIGRYGGDSDAGFDEEGRFTHERGARAALTPLFLGFETFVRGYAVESFSGDECTEVVGEPGACPEFDRLLGSRMALANVELRVPLVGTDQFGLIPFGFIPTELSFFADGGVAWTDARDPEIEFDTDPGTGRVPVFSTGASLRFNIFGRLVTELYWAYAFQRRDESQIGIHFAPGW